MKTLYRLGLWLFLAIHCTTKLWATDTLILPDTQNPDFLNIIAHYNAALSASQSKHTTAMTQHIKRYLDEAGEMLKEKRKARNTTGIAIATTTMTIFAGALSNLTDTGTFEMPPKVRREIENTIAEFNTGRSLIDTSFTNEEAKLLKQYSDEFAAEVLKGAPTLSSPEARTKIDERFQAIAHATVTTPNVDTSGNSPKSPAVANTSTNIETAAVSPVIAESGSAPNWMTVGTMTANIRSMEVLEIPLAEMRLGSNLLEHYSVMSSSTIEILFFATKTNFTGPSAMYRLIRIPKINDVSIMDWPTTSNGYHLNLRTPSPERIPFTIGFDLQVAAPAQPLTTKTSKRNITLSIRSTPSHATIYIDSSLQQDTLTPCTFQIPMGSHDFRLSLPGYQDLTVTNYNFTVGREINWIFKPLP